MLNKIISYSIRNKLVVGLLVLVLVGWGAYEVTKLPIDAVPDITDNQVQVITTSPALGAQDVERLVTFPVEQSCSNIPGLKSIRSFSRFGLSLVTIVFHDDVDIYWARQQISERLLQVEQNIPRGTGSPELAPVTTGLGEIYQYVVRPAPGYEGKYDAMTLRTIQDGIIRRQLLGTPGVADVSSFGGYLKQYEISVRPERLRSYGITISDVFDALERNNENTGGAYIEKGPSVLYIRTEGLTQTAGDIEQVVVRVLSNGMPVLIRDVGVVGTGHATRYGAMCYNDDGEVAGAVVMMLKGENSSAVIKKVRERVNEIREALPEGVIIEPFLDRTKMVKNAISTVQTNLLEGALIVVLVLVFFLGNLRAGLIVSSVIPLSMLFAIILMNRFGVSGNLMSLGAIDFGIIVDGSVIIVEAILHRFTHDRQFAGVNILSREEMDDAVETSSWSMIRSAAFSQAIILIVYLPILFLEGIEGKMFKPMAYTVSFAVVGAFLLSVTYVPMVSALFLGRKIDHNPKLTDRMMAALTRLYQPLLYYVLRARTVVLSVTLVLAVAAFAVLSNMGGEFIPELEEGDFAVEARVLTGSNLTTTIETTQMGASILLKGFPEVEKVVTKIGSSEIPTDPMPIEASDMMVILADKSEWSSASSFEELAAKMEEKLSAVPGLKVGFQYPVQMRFNELMTGARQDVVCKIFGQNLDTLALYAERLGSIAGSVDGAVNVYVEKVTGMPQVVIRYDRAAMATYGLNVADINRVVNAAFAGQAAGIVYEGEQRFDLVVRLEKASRKNISDIENLLIPVRSGLQIPLSKVAFISEIEGPNQIQRENTRRRIITGFNVSGRDVESIVSELRIRVDKELKLPKGYTITYGGAFENLNAAKERLVIVVPVALLLIFIMLYFAFNSVRQGLLIYSAIPLSAIGGIFSLWARGMPFSISAGVGFIALFGVAVLNGILLISRFNQLRHDGWADMEKMIVSGSSSRLRAILMTAFVPSMGFIPMAVSHGAGAEVQRPLATVVIGGLIFSMFLTLFVLPVLYSLFEAKPKFSWKRKAVVLTLLVLILPPAANSQVAITLNEALNKASSNNASLALARLNEKFHAEKKKTAFDPDDALIGMDYGQFNTAATDTRFSIAQTIRFPTVYALQAKALSSSYQISVLQRLHDEVVVAARVKRLFYSLLVLKEQRELLLQADSVYSEIAARTLKRFQAGDADITDNAMAENQKIQVRQQRLALETEYVERQRMLSLLMLEEKLFVPVSDSVVLVAGVTDTVLSSPLVDVRQEEVALRRFEYKLEKNRLLPSLTAGYSNLSFVGWQRVGDADQYFRIGDRFSYWTIGVGVPILSKARRAGIRASRINLRAAEVEAEMAERELNTELQGHLLARTRIGLALEEYKSTLLPNAVLMFQRATAKFESGDISFIEWVLLVNQSVSTRAAFFELVGRYNDVQITIDTLTNYKKNFR